MRRKYEFTGETKTNLEGIVIHQIRAIKDSINFKIGELGGWIEEEYSLSQDDDSWVSADSMVFGDSRVQDNAVVEGASTVRDGCLIKNDSIVRNSNLAGSIHVQNEAKVISSNLEGEILIGDKAFVKNSKLENFNVFAIRVCERALVVSSVVESPINLAGGTHLINSVFRSENDYLSMKYGSFIEADIREESDFMFFGNFGSEGRDLTAYRSRDKGEWKCTTGCFFNTIEKFRESVVSTHGDSKYAKEYLAIADVIDIRAGR